MGDRGQGVKGSQDGGTANKGTLSPGWALEGILRRLTGRLVGLEDIGGHWGCRKWSLEDFGADRGFQGRIGGLGRTGDIGVHWRAERTAGWGALEEFQDIWGDIGEIWGDIDGT